MMQLKEQENIWIKKESVNNMANCSNILISTNEYRTCKVMGRKCLFHQWIKRNDILNNQYLLGLIEFEDGHLEEVSVNSIIFDDNKIKEYYFKGREEK